jgi:hypothetical protein
MPWLGANGLFPGRGAPGREPPGRGPDSSRAAGADGRVAGRGPGVGAPGALGAGAAWAAWAAGAGAAGACEAAGAGSAGACWGAGAGAAGACAAGACAAGACAAGAGAAGALGPGIGAEVAAADAPGVGAAVDGAAALDGAAGAGAAGLLAEAAGGVAAVAGASGGNFSLYRRTTGSSTVELAVLTYSPISLRRSRRTLLVTPTSLARALTRILDTFLLRGGPDPRARDGPVSAGGCSLLRSHRGLISVKPASGSSVAQRRCHEAARDTSFLLPVHPTARTVVRSADPRGMR